MATIQWFPGHMAKAIRQLEENLHVVDIVFELVDARIPDASRNPEIERLIKDKPHLMILTKSDLADPAQTKNWIAHFKAMGLPAIAVDSKANITTKTVTKIAQSILGDKLAAEQQKGLKERPIRAITVGIPNVGKSTLLNRLVNKRVAQVGDTPGVTKGQQWLRSSSKLSLLDTPGILWPKFEDEETGQKLALTGAIKDKRFASDDVALFALHFFRETYPEALPERYKLSDADLDLSDVDLLLAITKKIGMKDDYDRASERLIQDTRKAKLGRYTLDRMDGDRND
ncbi:ribosome biogenesis GTPase YlqF [Secundilactobacillus paracollinoides]|uniref:Ribosome biogenesis GTPase A n=1 Tax=Secundilactobacillus paracollinoides TaxID=240427 RepID=A0A1B2J0S7_9LACO|nr:ribosome biogenesis GTPase YlqF [Secundilactobacillus paracollinoides]ANZ61999.1 ribosome biogenesis GTPase YlqF [Secundilactobacillus paracollinoides]ANZ67944.1 ribosome biogenesis GTPase YlqF [Secundilactobacillus paracollinoides]KRL75236.1 GTPase [Secundilactobacillus paracollinoides DSM 15502 = JCM 11969]